MSSSSDPRVNLIINRGRQLGRSLVLLAHYMVVFASFVGRSVQWMADAVKAITLFARYASSAFDSVYRRLNWRRDQQAQVDPDCEVLNGKRRKTRP